MTIGDQPLDATEHPSISTPASTGAAFVAGLVLSFAMVLSLPPVGWWPVGVFGVVALARVSSRPTTRPWRVAAAAGLGALPGYLYLHHWLIGVTWLGYGPLCVYMALYIALFFRLVVAMRSGWPGVPMLLAVPAVWVGLEVIRGELFMDGYPWYVLSQPIIESPLLSSGGRVVGMYGVSFLLAMLAGAAVDSSLPGPRWKRASAWPAALVVFIGVTAWGVATAPREGLGSTVRIGVVQSNVPQSNKLVWTPTQMLEDFRSLVALTARAAEAGPDIIVWPETMKPGLTLWLEDVAASRAARVAYTVEDGQGQRQILDAQFADDLMHVQQSLGVPMLVGEDTFDGLRFVPKEDGGLSVQYDARFNSVVMVEGGAVLNRRYNKIRRTPFGETMPYIRAWPWLNRNLTAFAARGMKHDLAGGGGPVVFEVRPLMGLPDAEEMVEREDPDYEELTLRDREWEASGMVRLVTPICFEATVTGVCRSMVMEGAGVWWGWGTGRRADVMIHVTNDGWFGSWWPGKLHHMQLARWRCLELATPMVRAANTGVSASIDTSGRVVKAGLDRPIPGRGTAGGKADVEGVLTCDVRTTQGVTLYGRTGNVVGYACAAWTALVACGLAVRRRGPGAVQ